MHTSSSAEYSGSCSDSKHPMKFSTTGHYSDSKSAEEYCMTHDSEANQGYETKMPGLG